LFAYGIISATPSVSSVHVVGDIVEDNTIKGNGKYFGGKEGLSKFLWFREKENGYDRMSHTAISLSSLSIDKTPLWYV
jgi:hypothetical protein